MAYKLLDEFQKLFAGKKYNHRISTQGDVVAGYLFEDLYDLGKSAKYCAVVRSGDRVANRRNKQVGRQKRRGDGTFGEKVPGAQVVRPSGLAVAIGDVATIEIGAEVKIMAKAMVKQLDRVGGDMEKQVEAFKKQGGNPICVGIVGINRAPIYTSYEAGAVWPTDGKKYKHPIQEADQVERRLIARLTPKFDELLVLRFEASNTAPHPFKWDDLKATESHYGAALVRILREYDRRF
jgi:hypothetical protein